MQSHGAAPSRSCWRTGSRPSCWPVWCAMAWRARCRSATCNMIDVHRCKAALVVMCVPERKLLGAMGRTERIVDVEDLKPARLHGGAELANESCTQPRRLGLAWRILKARDGRLRGQRFAALRTAR